MNLAYLDVVNVFKQLLIDLNDHLSDEGSLAEAENTID